MASRIIRSGTTGAALIVKYLKLQEVNPIIFGFTGGAVLSLSDQFYDNPHFRYRMLRTENACGLAACGIAKSTGNIAVCTATSGPGTTNLLNSMYNSITDGIPVLFLTGNVSLNALNTDAFQECPSLELSKAITKFNYQPHDLATLNQVLYKSFEEMTEGRPGPVHLDIPKDVLTAKTTKQLTIRRYEQQPSLHAIDRRLLAYSRLHTCMKDSKQDAEVVPPWLNPTQKMKNDYKKYVEIIDTLMSCKKPIALIGSGGFNAPQEIDNFLKIVGIPVTTTLHGLNIVNEEDELALKMVGMHGSVAANNAVQNADCLIVIGARIDDRVHCNLNKFKPLQNSCKIIDFEIDRKEQKRKERLIKPDVTLMGNCKDHLQVINAMLSDKEIPEFKEWKKYVVNLKANNSFRYKAPDNNKICGQQVIETIYDITSALDKDVILCTGTGNHQMLTAQFWTFGTRNRNMCHITSGSAGDMNFGLNACLGAAMANPDKLCISIEGDASHNMTLNSLISFDDYDIKNAKIFVFDDNGQEMVKTWQKLFFNDRIISTEHDNPDYVKLAESMKLKAYYVDKQTELHDTVKNAIEYDKGACLIHCKIVENGIASTLVPPGKGLHEQMLNFDCSPAIIASVQAEEVPC